MSELDLSKAKFFKITKNSQFWHIPREKKKPRKQNSSYQDFRKITKTFRAGEKVEVYRIPRSEQKNPSFDATVAQMKQNFKDKFGKKAHE